MHLFFSLSQQQCQTRVDWVLEELKRCGVLPSDTHVDARMFAMRSADHVSVCVCVCVCKLFSNQFGVYFFFFFNAL